MNLFIENHLGSNCTNYWNSQAANNKINQNIANYII